MLHTSYFILKPVSYIYRKNEEWSEDCSSSFIDCSCFNDWYYYVLPLLF